MIINTKKAEKELLEDHYLEVIEKINKYYDMRRGFILKDLLTKENDTQYYTYLTKGIIITLIHLKYLKIFSFYNGKNNFTYMVKNKIRLENGEEK